MPLPLEEKKLDLSPSPVEIKRPIKKMTGTATNKRVAAAPKLVVSITANRYSQKVSLTGPINLIPVRPRHPT